MTIEEYQKQANRTCPDLGSEYKNNQHMDLGVMTEIAGELLDPIKKYFAYGKKIDFVNFAEETGDVSWYVANKSTFSDINLSTNQLDRAYEEFFAESVAEVKAGSVDEALDFCGSLLCTMLVPFTGGKNMFGSPIVILAGLKAINVIFDVDYEEQLDKNIAKLKVRFPDKFDADKAINRDLDAERKALED